jgi:hypothetical protein
MTIRTRFTGRLPVALTGLAAAAALAVTLAGPASADTTPTPAAPATLAAPADSLTTSAADLTTPQTLLAPRFLRPEFFTINFPPGTGFAVGPVAGFFRDVTLSPVADEWFFRNGSVFVDHTAVPLPRFVNPFTCVGFRTVFGRWTMTGASGRYRNASGFGRFTASERVRFARSGGFCDRNVIRSESVFVTGSGLASR